jgi:molybdopterin-guanine dinucleotide biosynthesis protein A
VAVGGDSAELTALGLDYLDDQFPGEGPLGGVLSALALGSPVVVVACDLADLGSGTVTSLVDALGEHDAAVAFSGRAEPLCAIWTDRAVPVLRARFEAGERAMHRAIEGLDIAWVTVLPGDLRNVNTPDDVGSS